MSGTVILYLLYRSCANNSGVVDAVGLESLLNVSSISGTVTSSLETAKVEVNVDLATIFKYLSQLLVYPYSVYNVRTAAELLVTKNDNDCLLSSDDHRMKKVGGGTAGPRKK